ncbi:MAG: TIGR02147 family protein [Bacteriovoracaceae bacterium]
MKILKEKDYRKILQARALALKLKHGKNFNLNEIAKVAGVQSSYLTKVFNRDVHLNEDQLYSIVDYLEFDPIETEYINLLHKLLRCSLPKRKKQIEIEIRYFKNKFIKTEKEILAPVVSKDSFAVEYFLAPQLQIVHLLINLPQFKNDPSLIARHLNISSSQFDVYLKTLEEMKLIELNGSKIKVLKNHLFLSKDSTIATAYHNLMKTNSINRLNSLLPTEKYGLSVLFNANKDAFDLFRLKLIQFIQEIEKEVVASEDSTELYQMSIDFFPWT